MRAPSTRAAPFVLAGLALAAAAALAVAGRGIPTPWILIDELLHSELARGLRSVYPNGTTPGLAAYSCWTRCTGSVRVTTDDARARVVIGHFAPLPGGGGRVAHVTARASGGATLHAPAPPFRVEVRAAPGSHVAFESV